MALQPNPYQDAIYAAVQAATANVQVNAVAGSGKSTTMEQAVARMQGSTVVLAFNKTIADAMGQRLCAAGHGHARASTVHSLGNSACRRALRNCKVDADKGGRLAAIAYGDDSYESRTARTAVEKLAALCKLTLTEATRANLDALMDRYSVDIDPLNGEAERIYAAVPKAVQAAQQQVATIDFNDMIWLPVVLGLPVERFDWVCADEVQDENNCQRELMLKAVAPKGRVMTVGDKNQSIYGWAGAATDSMDLLAKRLNATLLPLNWCYRCPASHIKLAQAIVPHIMARPGAPDGVVVDAVHGKAVAAMHDGDLVICRMNAPLAGLAMQLIREGRKATIRGRDIGSNLRAMVTRWMRGLALAAGMQRLMQYRDREITKLEAAGKGAQAETLIDKVDTIVAIADGCHDVAGLNDRITKIFDDNSTEGTIFSSVHRAKGLEAERVMIYKPELLDWVPKRAQAWQVAEAANLKYVALTRAKQELWLVEGK